jgi:hypothetical protein
MTYTPVNIMTALDAVVLGQVDRRGNVAWLNGRCLPELKRHVQEVFDILDTSSAEDRMELVEADLGDPVTGYYEYALMREHIAARATGNGKNVGRGSAWTAQLRVGTRSDMVGVVTDDDEDDVEDYGVADCGPSGEAPAHLVVAVGQPRGPLYTCRTYFLQSGHDIADYELGERLVDDGEPAPVEKDTAWKPEARVVSDAPMLRRLYISIIRATHQALHSAGEGVDVPAEDVRGAVIASVCAALAQTRVLPEDFDIESALHVDVVAVNAKGKAHPEWQSPPPSTPLLPSDPSVPSVRVVRTILRSIPSQVSPGNSAGSVAFADSFMLATSGPGKATVRILTASIPYLASWLGDKEAGRAESLRRAIASHEKSVTADLGGLIVMRPVTAATDGERSEGGVITLDPCPLLLAGINDYSQALSGVLRTYDRGFSFDHARLGPMAFTFCGNTTGISVLESLAPTRPSLVVVKLSRSFRLYGLERASSSQVYSITIVIGGGSQRRFFREVLPVWTAIWEACGVEVETLDAPPAGFKSSYERCCVGADANEQDNLRTEFELGDTDIVGLSFGDVSLCVNKERLQEFCAGSPQDVEPASDVAAPIVDEAISTVPITVVCGVPGSGHHLVAKSVLSFARGASWQVVTEHADDMQATLGSLLEAARAGESGTRILLVTSGYTDITRLTADVMCSTELCELCHVAAVIAVVRPSNFSLERRGAIHIPNLHEEEEELFTESTQIIPRLLDQCAWGWTSVIIVLGGGSTAQKLMQDRLQKVNPDAVIARGAYTMQWEECDTDPKRVRTADAILGMLSESEMGAALSVDRFGGEAMTRTRHMLDSEWPAMSSANQPRRPDRIVFNLPPQLVIDRARLLANIRPLFSGVADASWPSPSLRLFYASIEAITTDTSDKAVVLTITTAQANVEVSTRTHDGAVVLCGENLKGHENWLKQVILRSRPALAVVAKSIQSTSDLTDEQREEIQRMARNESGENGADALPGATAFFSHCHTPSRII